MAYFPDIIIERVWSMAKVVEGYAPDTWRQDFAGAWICRNAFEQNGKFGWEIDFLKPLSRGGANSIENLISIHWMNNRIKSDNYPCFDTKISSEGNNNVVNIQHWRVNNADDR